MISEFLFIEDDATKVEKTNYINLKIEIRQLLKNDFNRDVLSEILLDLRKDVAGDTLKRLFKLYQDLGLHKDAYAKLKSWRWEVISKGILELTQMQVTEAYNFITKFINDKRATIRKQAEIALVTLKPEGINYFLDNTKYKISEWQQLKLLDVIRNQEDYLPPPFKAWLTSQNRYVVLFALRLIKYYNQNDAYSSLIELVKHKNNQIKEEAIACIKEFNVVEALATLKLVFWKSNTDLKIAILDAIGVLGSEADIEFLTLIETKEANFSVKSKALSSINTISPECIIPTKDIADTSGYRIPDDITVDVAQSHMKAHEGAKALEQIDEVISTTEKTEPEIEKTEVIEPDQINTNTDKTQENVSNVEKKAAVNIDFLPIVIEVLHKEGGYRPNKQTNRSVINELEVVYEEVLHTPLSNISNMCLEKPFNWNTVIASTDLNKEELAFLPVVIDSLEETKTTTEPTSNNNSTIGEINQIEVCFDEVVPTPPQEKTANIAPETELKVGKQTETEVKGKSATILSFIEQTPICFDYSCYNTPEIFDMPIFYNEIGTDKPPKGQDIIEIEVNDLEFLLFSSEMAKENEMDDESTVPRKTIQPHDPMSPQDEQKFKKIINELIDFKDAKQVDEIIEEFQDWPSQEFDQNVIDIEFIPLVSDEQEKQDIGSVDKSEQQYVSAQEDKSLKTENIKSSSNDIISDNNANIPKVICPQENSEETSIQLLDDIEELGDEREIPLLKELLVNEKYATVKERIGKLIDKFVEVNNPISIDDSLKPFNVFEDLFRSCDTEAKLILMDEIEVLGDQSDLVFLERLLEDDHAMIRYKASQVHETLRIRLTLEAEVGSQSVANTKSEQIEQSKKEETPQEYISLLRKLEIDLSGNSEIFNIEFELTEDLEKNTLASQSSEEEEITPTTAAKGSFMNQLQIISNKIINKLNG